MLRAFNSPGGEEDRPAIYSIRNRVERRSWGSIPPTPMGHSPIGRRLEPLHHRIVQRRAPRVRQHHAAGEPQLLGRQVLQPGGAAFLLRSAAVRGPPPDRDRTAPQGRLKPRAAKSFTRLSAHGESARGVGGVCPGCRLPPHMPSLQEWLTPLARPPARSHLWRYAHVTERVIGCRVDRLELSRADGYRLDPERLQRALADEPDLAILVNPNSPTGQHVPREVLEAVLARAPSACGSGWTRPIPITWGRENPWSGSPRPHERRRLQVPLQGLRAERLARRLPDLSSPHRRRDPLGDAALGGEPRGTGGRREGPRGPPVLRAALRRDPALARRAARRSGRDRRAGGAGRRGQLPPLQPCRERARCRRGLASVPPPGPLSARRHGAGRQPGTSCPAHLPSGTARPIAVSSRSCAKCSGKSEQRARLTAVRDAVAAGRDRGRDPGQGTGRAGCQGAVAAGGGLCAVARGCAQSVSHTSNTGCSTALRPGLSANIQPEKMRFSLPSSCISSTSTKVVVFGGSVGARE